MERSKMPPRPAFGAALRDLRQAYRDTLRREARGSIEGVTMGMLEDAAKAGAAAVKASYERGAPGPPVGPGQAARKAGTPGEGPSCWLGLKARSWPTTCAPKWTGGKSHNVARRATFW